MSRWRLQLCVLGSLGGLGCGPAVSLAGDTDGDEGTAAGDSTGRSPTEDTSASGDGPDSAPQPVTTGPAPVTVTTAPPETSVGPEPTGSTGEPPETCWTRTPLYEVPDDLGMLLRDQDGDGATEAWLLTSGDPQTTTAIITGHDGSVISEYTVPGFLIDVVDIDGDGLRDLAIFEFQGGGAPRLRFERAVGAFAFTGELEPLELSLQAGFPLLLDVGGSPAVDALQIDEELASLSTGLGGGTFEPTAELLIEGLPSSRLTPVRGAPQLMVLTPATFGDSCAEGATHLLDASAGLDLLAATDPSLPKASAGDVILSTATPGGDVFVYVDSCLLEGAQLIEHQVQSGSADINSSVLFAGSDWATAGDFDGDGDIDFLVSEEDAVWFTRGGPNGPGRVPEEDTLLAPSGAPVDGIVIADTDGDGRDEALVRVESSPGSVVLERVELDSGCD